MARVTCHRSAISNKPERADYGAGQVELATVGHPQWLMLMRVAALPSLFNGVLYYFFKPLDRPDRHSGLADDAFNSTPDSCTQGVFFLIALCHVAFFMFSNKFGHRSQRKKVVDTMRLEGHESIVNINCGRGYWATELASRLDEGRVIGVDSWGSELTPYDQQWIIYNSVCEGVEDRIEVGGSWDLYSLPFRTDEHDVIFSSWLPWYDEVGAERVIAEMLRCTRLGGHIYIVLPKFYTNCVEETLHEMGVSELKSEVVASGYYVSQQVFMGKKCHMSVTRRRIHRSSSVDEVFRQDSGDGYGSNVPSWVPQTLCFLTGCLLWTAHLNWMWCYWEELKIPGEVSPEGQMGSAFVSNNVTWLGLVLVEIQLEMTMRPAYVLHRYGWIRSWFLIGCHHWITAILWNLGCWIPGLLVELSTGYNKEWVWISLSIPCIAVVMHIEEALLHMRMRLFIDAFSNKDVIGETVDTANVLGKKSGLSSEWASIPSPLTGNIAEEHIIPHIATHIKRISDPSIECPRIVEGVGGPDDHDAGVESTLNAVAL